MQTALQLINKILAQLEPDEIERLLKYLYEGVGCLDTRSLTSCCQYRLSNATLIDEQQLKQRLFELPVKSTPFILIPHSQKSRQTLTQNGYQNFIEFKLNESDWKQLYKKHNEWFISKSEIRYIPLFEPCELLKKHIDHIELCLFEHYRKMNHNGTITLSCCDIGCGSGRDDIYLSLRNINKQIKWNINCVDYNEQMLQRISQFASNANVSDQINIIKSKIKGDNTINLYRDIFDAKPFLIYDLNENKQYGNHEYYFEKQYDLILCVRFLERCIVTKLWKTGKMMKLNGYLLIFTFMTGCEKIGNPKNPNYLLKKGELRQMFSDQTMFKIIEDRETKLEDGRPMNMFLCQKINNDISTSK